MNKDHAQHASMPPPALCESWSITKPQVQSTGGIVAAQHHEAARIGADVLIAGGNAMDAALAAAMALSVVEPWLSGLGGGGFLLHCSSEGHVETLNFNLRAPMAADPKDYPLEGGDSEDWFNWPKVQNDCNLIGPMSICIPGAVAGFDEALARHGTLSWAEVLAPTIELAERGMWLDWFAELAIAIDTPGLLQCPHATSLFLDLAARKPNPDDSSSFFLPMPAKAKMLRQLAKNGAQDFYEGEIATLLLRDLQSIGSKITAADLASYKPNWQVPISASYRDRVIYTIPGLSGGPSLLETMKALALEDMPLASDARSATYFANTIRAAYKTRLQTMGHASAKQDCTSHISAMDRDGNMVALTNTLLSRFGSKTVAPSLGLTLNNGMMWFDPRLGKPNSIAPGAAPLANMSPAITTLEGKPDIAIGAAGGRQIFPAIAQILSKIIDRSVSPEKALHEPRIDASSPIILVNRAASADTASAIAKNHPVQITENSLYPVQFAIPSLVQAGRNGKPNVGAVHPNSPWTAACAEAEE